jgi:hypothetical protein
MRYNNQAGVDRDNKANYCCDDSGGADYTQRLRKSWSDHNSSNYPFFRLPNSFINLHHSAPETITADDIGRALSNA